MCGELIPTHTPAPGGIHWILCFALLCFALLGFSIVTLFFIHEGSQSCQIKILFLIFMIDCDIVLGSLMFEFSYRMLRPCLVGRKFYVFFIKIFRKQGKHV